MTDKGGGTSVRWERAATSEIQGDRGVVEQKHNCGGDEEDKEEKMVEEQCNSVSGCGSRVKCI